MPRFIAVASLAFLCLPAFALGDKMTEGRVVSAIPGENGADGELVTRGNFGKETTFSISPRIKIRINNKSAKLADLERGDKVKVITDDKDKVKEVQATRKMSAVGRELIRATAAHLTPPAIPTPADRPTPPQSSSPG